MSLTHHSSNLIGGHETQETRTRHNFLECLRLIERLHRRMLDIVIDFCYAAHGRFNND